MSKFKVGDIVAIPGYPDDSYEILYVGEEEYRVKAIKNGTCFTWLQSSCANDDLDHSRMAAKQFDKDLKKLLEE